MAKSFEEHLKLIKQESALDGPHTNVLEPKYTAREKMLALMAAVREEHSESPTLLCQRHYVQCLLFMGNNRLETEEEKEGFEQLFKAYTLVTKTVAKEIVPKLEDLKPTLASEITSVNEPVGADSEFVVEVLQVLNTLGLHMSAGESPQRMNDARKVLHLAESLYKTWNAQFSGPSMDSLMIGDDGTIQGEATPDAELRLTMDALHTSTLFFLAQVYTHIDTTEASKYAHLTMVGQLQTKSEFSRRSWAENALHLNGFFSSNGDYGRALHCLEAAVHVMPHDLDAEESIGQVQWAYGRFHLSRLRHHAFGANTGSQPDRYGSWFVPFPLPLPPVRTLPPITTFDEAREEFKRALHYLTKAKTYYPFDGQCGDYIMLCQDISGLYHALSVFETDRERKVAMHYRRVKELEGIPGELNPNAYLTTIRQLLYDIGEVHTDIMDVRNAQKKDGDAAALSDRQFNLLNDKTASWYKKFIDTFEGTKQVEEVRVAVFRAKMRLAALITKKYYSTPQEEYEAIGLAVTAYGDVLKFVENNPIPDIAEELEIAKQMHTLLPGKQKSILQAYAK